MSGMFHSVFGHLSSDSEDEDTRQHLAPPNFKKSNAQSNVDECRNSHQTRNRYKSRRDYQQEHNSRTRNKSTHSIPRHYNENGSNVGKSSSSGQRTRGNFDNKPQKVNFQLPNVARKLNHSVPRYNNEDASNRFKPSTSGQYIRGNSANNFARGCQRQNSANESEHGGRNRNQNLNSCIKKKFEIKIFPPFNEMKVKEPLLVSENHSLRINVRESNKANQVVKGDQMSREKANNFALGCQRQNSTNESEHGGRNRNQNLNSCNKKIRNQNVPPFNEMKVKEPITLVSENHSLRINVRESNKANHVNKGDRLPREKGKGDPHLQPVRHLGFKRLEELIEKEPNEILLTLNSPTSGFSELLNSEKIAEKPDLIALIFIALGKSSKSDHRQNLSIFINMIIKIPSMIYIVQKYMVNFNSYFNKEFHREAFQYFLEFLTCYNQLLSATAVETLAILLPLLKSIPKIVQTSYPEFYDVIYEKIYELEFQRDSFLKDHTEEIIKVTSKMEQLQLIEPPENFQTLSILPIDTDIKKDHMPFLRPNVTDGKYNSTEHYLDVQFRLLREDYIRPLREGIAVYQKVKKEEKLFKRNKDVKMYFDVHIIQQQFFRGNLVYLASFDIKEFSKVNWEFSKRFLSGSLVCLSDDDFETSLFASIAFRDVKKLENGVLILKFEDLTDKILNISPTQTFIMIETDAYFEAYRHNLMALQKIQVNDFPLSKYIVNMQIEIDNPDYLRGLNVEYDMGPLLLPLDEFKKEQEFLIPIKKVSVLNEELWPTAEQLKLDESQFKAIKAAITKEFVVIQGPPGTGKTYIGLRIVQLLLHNISCWKSLEHPCPILIVCYTNHALDQFLEGILLFTKKIVRVGGRSSSEKLAEYQLEILRRKLQDLHEVPSYIHSGLRRKNWELKDLGKDMNSYQKDIEKSVQRILNEHELLEYIKPEQYSSLVSIPNYDGQLMIHKWLDYYLSDVKQHNVNVYQPQVGIAHPLMNQVGHFSVADNGAGALNINYGNQFTPGVGVSAANEVLLSAETNANLNEDNDIDNEDMVDVQYIEDMRGIENEYADINFDDIGQEEDLQFGMNDGWKMQGGIKKYRETIMKKVKNTLPMMEQEVDSIDNVWMLNYEDRWRLYRYWLDLYIRGIQKETLILQEKIRTESKELDELRREENFIILRTANVVGMTTTGAAKYREIVQYLNPRIVIVEEAAEILESHIITSLAPKTHHLILIGDHRQLKPNPNVYELAKKFHMDVSLFERMVKNGIEFYMLSVQHRMHPSISSLLVPHIYTDLKNHDSVSMYENIIGVSKNMFFVTHNSLEGNEYDSKSKVNKHEASFINRLCQYLICQGYAASQITVLTAYSGQLFELKRLIKPNPLLKGIRISVVDNFQGEENDIILISFVRSNEEGMIGFLKIANRVCVALSRAKKGLYAIGNFSLLAEKSPLWKDILVALKKQEAIGTSLALKCVNHPEVTTNVATDSDFNNVPEGGCIKPCEYRLICGHSCPRMCHPYDLEHENVKCDKPCQKVICDNQHKCKKRCYQACGSCNVSVLKQMPICKHSITVPCSISPETYSCTAPCRKFLQCGHYCKNVCGKKCSDLCLEFVQTRLVCGHDMKIECYKIAEKENFIKDCKVKCNMVLKCDHICSGTCGSCYQGRLHQRCNKNCKRILVCGHSCQAKCSRSCPPCSEKCMNSCNHSKCPDKCGYPCTVCKEPCLWNCVHQKCTKECGEFCDREPCIEPCRKRLKCKHPCVGMCGEPCPKCAICNPEVREIFFGSEDDDDAKFIELQDCKHIFEIEGLTNWMNLAMADKSEIKMKECPKCKTVIRKNLRFGNIIKACLKNINKVKAKIFGDTRLNKHKIQFLSLRLTVLKNYSNYSYLLSGMHKVLSNTKKISHPEIIRYENIISLMEEYLPLYIDIRHTALPTSTTYELPIYRKITVDLIEQFVSEEYLTASDQQLEELSWEIQKLSLIQRLIKFISERQIKTLSTETQNLLNEAKGILCQLSPFGKADEKQILSIFEKMGSAAINISAHEKKAILKAMDLSRGHWYMCPNGHVYCITECGGAMEESVCNECGAKIGGASHALRRDNRLATDMDGAITAAWPQANDLRNYIDI